MLFGDKKDKNNTSKRNKPIKICSMPEIQLDKLLDKSTKTPKKKIELSEAELNLALSNTSNSSRNNKCEDHLGLRSPSGLNDSHVLSSQKSTHINQSKHNISRSELLSKYTDEKPNLVKVVEELADVKHSNSKLQNEISMLNQKIKNLKSVLTMRNQEIELLNKKHKDVVDRFSMESQNYQKTNAEYFTLQDIFRKQHLTFKSTLSTLLDIIDSCIIQPLNKNNKLTLSSNNALENTVETISFFKKEEGKRKILREVKEVLLHNFSYIHKNVHLDLKEEIDKIKDWEIASPSKPLLPLENVAFHKNNSSEEQKYSVDNLYSTLVHLSPKFSHEKEDWSSQNVSSQFMSNFNGSLRDLEIVFPIQKEGSVPSINKPEVLRFNKLSVDFNDTPTEFNIDILDADVLNKEVQPDDQQKNV